MALEPSSSYVAPSNLIEQSSSSLPMFDVEQVQLAFSVAADFVAAQVANNVLVLALSTNRILRIDLDSPEDVEGRLPHLPRSKCQPPQLDLTEHVNRHRSPKEILRSRSHQTHVPRPFGVSSYHYHNPGRKLLSPCAVTSATTQAIVPFKERFN